ncbi:hypothetical protein E3E14_17180 [Streptomyces sp. ICN441]|uniref:hypothetical protein n=1 Tax=Streptomyces sp. ICN441 TaxID=2558286 RepID=UPI00106959EC|nr:hypothetical protein [Streptomyces sp. ICN441]TFE48698.1 hypothetical protein E3E14_17180 [Streptomyces sp. ICN441]
MKQAAAKTLGVAALGAAFAAAAAGSASATTALPAVGTPLDALSAVQPAALPAVEDVTGQSGPRILPAPAPVGGLLGGLPVGATPLNGLPLDGLPLPM